MSDFCRVEYAAHWVPQGGIGVEYGAKEFKLFLPIWEHPSPGLDHPVRTFMVCHGSDTHQTRSRSRGFGRFKPVGVETVPDHVNLGHPDGFRFLL